MSRRSKIAIAVLTLAPLFAGPPRQLRAQDQPAVLNAPTSSGFQLPQLAGTLRYALTASESVTFGYNGSNGTYESTNLSGDLAYLSSSASHPFSAVYSGGYLFATSGQPSSFFQNLAVSQSFVVRPWNIVLSDSISYLPDAPVGGLSGIPGLGDVGIPPITVIQNNSYGLLSNYGTRLYNTASASASRNITNRTSGFLTGSMSIVRFPGSDFPGIDTNQEMGSAGVTHTLSPRTSITGSYSYSHFGYPSYDFAYKTQTGTIAATHQWTQRLTSSASIGPQYSSVANEPSTLSLAFSADLAYQIHDGSLGLSASRGVNNGQGFVSTGVSDSVSGVASHRLGEMANIAASVSYYHTSTLPISLGPQFTANNVSTSGQFSRSLTRSISVYASYTLLHQLTNESALGLNTLNGTAQTAAFGITYSPPRAINVGR